MIYGYLRVSSDEQDVNSQKQGVVSFAESKGWAIEKYITDEGVSGGKDPDKRNLGPLLKSLKKGDIVICSEISRLGRDLYMVMDILHFCMDRGCVIYTVKDKFVLGDDIQSKVLAFAFGLAAEIERQMIRQRTKEGLRLRMKMGVLVGRPIGSGNDNALKLAPYKDEILLALKYGASGRSIAQKLDVDRNTLYRSLNKWGVPIKKKEDMNYIEREKIRRRNNRKCLYKDGDYLIVPLPREDVKRYILEDKTIPEIAALLPQFSYEQLYDSILCDDEFNPLYREHGHLKAKKQQR